MGQRNLSTITTRITNTIPKATTMVVLTRTTAEIKRQRTIMMIEAIMKMVQKAMRMGFIPLKLRATKVGPDVTVNILRSTYLLRKKHGLPERPRVQFLHSQLNTCVHVTAKSAMVAAGLTMGNGHCHSNGAKTMLLSKQMVWCSS